LSALLAAAFRLLLVCHPISGFLDVDASAE